jgi:hypothetical protein
VAHPKSASAAALLYERNETPVTEAEWLSCTSPARMLTSGRVRSARKLRLFACACVRNVWPLLRNERSRRLVEQAEKYADGLVTRKELAAARAAAPGRDGDPAGNWAARAAVACAISAAREAAESASNLIVNARKANLAEWAKQADLLRELVGNPFQPVVLAAPLPATVRQLAESLYNGADCAFALHDALLEAGQAPLAEHFTPADKWHPKGCWAVDMILDKS